AHGNVDDGHDVPARPKANRPSFSLAWAIESIVIPLPFAAVVVYVETHLLRDYGWTLFVGLPFVLPMLSVVIYGLGRPITLGQSLLLGAIWLLVALVALIVTAFEGLI